MDTKSFRAPPRPAIAEVLWIHQPILPCTSFPEAQAGIVFIQSTTHRGQLGCNYLVSPHTDASGNVLGWRFTKGTPEGDVHHDIDNEFGSCDCPDSQFRRRACKHVKALQTMNPIDLTTHHPAAEASEHAVRFPILDAVGEVIEPPDYAA